MYIHVHVYFFFMEDDLSVCVCVYLSTPDSSGGHQSNSEETSELHSTYRSGGSSSNETTLLSSHRSNGSQRKPPSLDHSPKRATWQSAAMADMRKPASSTPPTREDTECRTHGSSFHLSAPPLLAAHGAHGVPSLLPRSFDYCESQSSVSELNEERYLEEEGETGDCPEPSSPATLHRPWHYMKSKELCASLASLESMGMCRVDNGLRFDPSCNYSSGSGGGGNAPTSPPGPVDGVDSPSRVTSCDSLSDLAGNSNTFSRNESSNSIGFVNSTHPHLPLHHSVHRHAADSPTPLICGSIDSGYSYENSTDISSLTDSSHTGMNDSVYVGRPRFTIGLDVRNHCNPEHWNVFMNPSNGLCCCEDSAVSVDVGKLAKPSCLHIEVDSKLEGDLQQTAMKRQMSDLSCVSTTVRRSDTLESSTTPVASSEDGRGEVWSEGGGGGKDSTLPWRRRSGAFSYSSRVSRSDDDYPQLSYRGSCRGEKERGDGSNTDTLPRPPTSASNHQLHLQPTVERVEDEVFEDAATERSRVQHTHSHLLHHHSDMHLSHSNSSSRHFSGQDAFSSSPCLPEVRVSSSPSPIPDDTERFRFGDTATRLGVSGNYMYIF